MKMAATSTTSNDWFKQAKMYHILIDRFNGNLTMKNDNQFLGGTI